MCLGKLDPGTDLVSDVPSSPIVMLGALSPLLKTWSDPREVILPEVWLYGLMEEFRMPRKRRKAEEIVTKLRLVEGF